MVEVIVVREVEAQKALLEQASVPSKEAFMEILSQNPTSLRIVIDKKHG